MCDKVVGKVQYWEFQKGCLLKKYYKDIYEANFSMLKQWKKGRLSSAAGCYKCIYCNGYHLTKHISPWKGLKSYV